MPSFFDLQKFAATGIASADMSAFDKARALAAFGGGAVQTLTDVPPLSFRANGKPLISWSMIGNGAQSGTPTPDAPIMPTFCGVRTGNLADTVKGGLSATDGSEVAYNATQSQIRSQYIPCDALTNYIVCSTNYSCNSFVAFYAADKSFISRTSGAPISQPRIISTPENAAFMRVAMYHASDGQIYPFDAGAKIMLNTGTTALPYEPYGWAEKITCAGQTTPVYLGQVSTVRRVKKLVLTGEETFEKVDSGESSYFRHVIGVYGSVISSAFICTHFQQTSITTSTTAIGANASNSSTYGSMIVFRPSGVSTITTQEWKAYLAAQYAAGTPVCVWYVLAEPQTAIINEPLCKIGDYADELHSTDAAVTIQTVKGQNTLTVESELPPSEMTITYNE